MNNYEFGQKENYTTQGSVEKGESRKSFKFVFFVRLVIILFAERQADSEILSSSIITLRIENIAGPTVCCLPY